MSTARAAERSMQLLRKEGYIVGRAEHFNSFIKRRIDLFGFVDLVCLGYGQITAVQVTKNFLYEHLEKIRANAAARRWLECGGRIVVHHWRVRSKNKVKRWDLEVIEVTV